MTIKHLYPVIEPSLNLDFANSKKLDPRITFTRGSIGTYVGDDGLIKTAAQHEARFDHDSDGNSLGLLVEESRTNLAISSQAFSGAPYAVVNTTVADNQTAAPDGTSTAALVLETATTAAHNIARDVASKITVTASTVYTFSVFLKPNGRDFVQITSNTGDVTGNPRANFDIANGTLETVDSGVTAAIFRFPNGWVRISYTVTSASTTINFVVSTITTGTAGRFESFAGDITKGFYIWGYCLEAGSFPTSYIPTSGSTVTRAADVASISGDNFGVFRTNLLEYSEEFDQAAWESVSGQRTVTSNQITDPDGTVTADLVTANGINASHFVSQAVTLTATPYTFSVFAKAGTNNFVQLRAFSAFGGQAANFNLATGTVGVTAFGGIGSITAIGNGWYRCVLTFTPNAATSSIGIYLITNANSPGSETNSLSTSVYLWGAQLEEGSTATDYIKSDVNFVSRASSATYYDANGVIQTAAVDEARTAAYLPDGSGNFISAGPLLLEDAGTNLLLRSEEFDNASWTKVGLLAFGSGSVANAITAPNGTLTADLIVPSTGTGNHGVALAWPGSGTRLVSVYIKASGYSQVAFTSSSSIIVFDLATQSVSGSPIDFSAGSVIAVNDGWYRVSAAITSPAGGNLNFLVASSSSISFPGNGTSGIYIWGAQLEEGSSYPTSYIPTQGSTVTRAADVSTSAVASVFESDWYRQDEGTVFADAQTPYPVTSGKFPTMLSITDGTTTDNNFSIGFLTETLSSSLVENNNTNATPNYMSPLSGVRRRKISIAAADNDVFAVTNGTLTSPKVNNILLPRNHAEAIIGGNLSYNSMNGTIRRLTYWPQRLPNETLQTITQ